MDDGIGYTRDQLEPQPGTRALSDCVGLYFEVDDDVVTDKGGAAGATNYVTGVYNQVATLYANESINTVVTKFCLDDQQPLFQYFQQRHAEPVPGLLGFFRILVALLGQLLSYQVPAGHRCRIFGHLRVGPEKQPELQLHQFYLQQLPDLFLDGDGGHARIYHTFGSRHTHACVWNGNNTAIDGCSGSTEGLLPAWLPFSGWNDHVLLPPAKAWASTSTKASPPARQCDPQCDLQCRLPGACGPPSCEEDGFQNGNETGVDCGVLRLPGLPHL